VEVEGRHEFLAQSDSSFLVVAEEIPASPFLTFLAADK
jgi:hypothetical protein